MPVLEHGDLEELESTQKLVRYWHEACHGRFDPRHPSHQLRRDVEIAICLCRAEDVLRHEPGQQVADPSATAKELTEEAIQMGIGSPNQLLRAIKLCAIAHSTGGSQDRRREVLTRVLDAARETLRRQPVETPAAFRARLVQVTVGEIQSWTKEAEALTTTP
jgi:hypothetical protein